MNTNKGHVLDSAARISAASLFGDAGKSSGISEEVMKRLTSAFAQHADKCQKAHVCGYWGGDFEGGWNWPLLTPIQLCSLASRLKVFKPLGVMSAFLLCVLSSIVAVMVLVAGAVFTFRINVTGPQVLAILAILTLTLFSIQVFLDIGWNLILRKIIRSGEFRLYEWLDSMAAARILFLYDSVSKAWKISGAGSWDELQKDAERYLTSLAMWVLSNERINIHSQETADARMYFGHYHAALSRIGLADEKYDRYYAIAQERLVAYLAAQEKKETPSPETIPTRPMHFLLPH